MEPLQPKDEVSIYPTLLVELTFSYVVTWKYVHGTAKVTINVININDKPVAVSDSYSVKENTTLSVSINNGVLSNDSDIDNDTLTVNLVTNVSSGTLDLKSDGSFTYTPSNNFVGQDSFTYYAKDDSLTSNTVEVKIIVYSIPVSVADTFSQLKILGLRISS